MRRREEINTLLIERLEAKRKAWNLARVRFSDLVCDVPSGVPHPDGSLRLRTAGYELRATGAEYTIALKQFSAFILNDIVPDEFNLN